MNDHGCWDGIGYHRLTPLYPQRAVEVMEISAIANLHVMQSNQKLVRMKRLPGSFNRPLTIWLISIRFLLELQPQPMPPVSWIIISKKIRASIMLIINRLPSRRLSTGKSWTRYHDRIHRNSVDDRNLQFRSAFSSRKLKTHFYYLNLWATVSEPSVRWQSKCLPSSKSTTTPDGKLSQLSRHGNNYNEKVILPSIYIYTFT